MTTPIDSSEGPSGNQQCRGCPYHDYHGRSRLADGLISKCFRVGAMFIQNVGWNQPHHAYYRQRQQDRLVQKTDNGDEVRYQVDWR